LIPGLQRGGVIIREVFSLQADDARQTTHRPRFTTAIGGARLGIAGNCIKQFSTPARHKRTPHRHTDPAMPPGTFKAQLGLMTMIATCPHLGACAFDWLKYARAGEKQDDPTSGWTAA